MSDGRGNYRARILAVDDDPTVTRIIRAMLEVDGHRVDEARTAVGLAARAAEAASDLVLLDMNMPELSGLDALDEFRLAGSAIPVILLTGEEGRESLAREALARGATDCLLKPVAMDRLHAAVRHALRVAQFERQLSEARAEVAMLRAELADLRGQGRGRP